MLRSVVVESFDAMRRCVDLGSMVVVSSIVLEATTTSVIALVSECSHGVQIAIYVGVLGTPSVRIRHWAQASIGEFFFLEHADLIYFCGGHLQPDNPEHDHQEDGRDYLEGRAARGAPPQDEVLAH